MLINSWKHSRIENPLNGFGDGDKESTWSCLEPPGDMLLVNCVAACLYPPPGSRSTPPSSPPSPAPSPSDSDDDTTFDNEKYSCITLCSLQTCHGTKTGDGDSGAGDGGYAFWSHGRGFCSHGGQVNDGGIAKLGEGESDGDGDGLGGKYIGGENGVGGGGRGAGDGGGDNGGDEDGGGGGEGGGTCNGWPHLLSLQLNGLDRYLPHCVLVRCSGLSLKQFLLSSKPANSKQLLVWFTKKLYS
ncbi:hypothetical protein Tco_1033718 [Tanacetum coccineum]